MNQGFLKKHVVYQLQASAQAVDHVLQVNKNNTELNFY